MELIQRGYRWGRVVREDTAMWLVLFIVIILVGSIFFEKVPRDITHPKEKVRKKSDVTKAG